jgi:hypothetical protein
MENKTSKYFKYAIGEILLVVIGILIALWFNQQVNENKVRQTEKNVLEEIRANLSLDINEINEDLNYMDTINIASDFVTEYLKNQQQPNEAFGYNVLKLRTTPHFNPNLSGYNLLVSKGIEIIQNNALRKAISNHFESLYSYYKAYEQERVAFKIQNIVPAFTQHFIWLSIPESPFLGTYIISQQDFEHIKADDSFLKLVSVIKEENILVQSRGKRVKQSIMGLSRLLDEELKTK